jgi:hypothetical protein
MAFKGWLTRPESVRAFKTISMMHSGNAQTIEGREITRSPAVNVDIAPRISAKKSVSGDLCVLFA